MTQCIRDWVTGRHCADELSGVQALERKHPSRPMRLGRVELQEFEYERNGTQTFIVNFHVQPVRGWAMWLLVILSHPPTQSPSHECTRS